MPWSGGTFSRSNGTFSGANVWLSDANAGVKIVTDRHDTHDQDIATGINTCLTKDGQNTATANLPMGGFRHTTVGTAQARTQYAAASQVQDNTFNWCGTASGTTGTALTISPAPATTALTIGQRFQFISPVANTGTTFLTVSGAGSAIITASDGTAALASGAIGSDELVDVAFSNVAGGIFQKLNAKTNQSLTTLTVSGGGTLSGTYAGNPVFSGSVAVGTASIATLSGTSAGNPEFSGTMTLSGIAQVTGTSSLTGGGTMAGTFSGAPVFSGAVAMTGSPVITTPTIFGVTNAATAGTTQVGQIVSTSIAVASAVALTSSTAANILALGLPAGDWNIFANAVGTASGSTGLSQVIASISTASGTHATPPNNGGYALWPGPDKTGNSPALYLGMPLNVATATTAYLVVTAGFNIGALGYYGSIVARRAH